MQLLLSFCCISSALAQHATGSRQELMVDKLGFSTYTATIVPNGSLQLETELSYFRNNRQHFYMLSANLPAAKLRYGIIRGLEINAGTALTYTDTRFRITDKTCLFCHWQYAKDYVTAGLKATLLRYHEGRGLLSVVGETYIPRTIGLGVESILDLPTIQIVNADRINDRLGYILNLGATFEYDREAFDFFDIRSAVTYEPMEWGIIFLALNHRYEVNPNRGYNTQAEAGFLFSPHATLQVQTAIGLRLVDNLYTNDFSGKIGLAWMPHLFGK